VTVIEAADGSICIRYGDRDLQAKAFPRDGNITQQDVEDNKRLGHVLDVIRRRQLEVSEQQLQSRNRSLREKNRLKRPSSCADSACDLEPSALALSASSGEDAEQ
jgi:hypothetical protein